MNIALLTAAGSGSRMHQDIPKQFLHVDNKPIIIYTMQAFENNPQIDAIVVVTMDSWKDFIWAYAKQFNITKLRWVVSGGATGQESIHNGLMALKETCEPTDVVLVHDGNRPLITNDIIADSLSTFSKYGSAVAAIPCTEAVFKSADSLSYTISIPREQLFRTQTPHTYTLGKLLWAHEQAAERNITNTTASCTLMQALGETVYLSQGSEKNFKLTTTDDLDIFRAFLNNGELAWLK